MIRNPESRIKLSGAGACPHSGGLVRLWQIQPVHITQGTLNQDITNGWKGIWETLGERRVFSRRLKEIVIT